MDNNKYSHIKDYYCSQLNNIQRILSNTKKRIYLLGTIRLLIAICTITLAYFLMGQGTAAICINVSIGLVVFFVLLLICNQLQKKKAYLEISLTCCENEINAIDYDFSAFDGAPEKINPEHAFSLDLDIFGNNSLFQSINRTCTAYGKQVLVSRFENPFQSTEKIKSTQESIAEISRNPGLIHHFQVTGLSCPSKDSDLKEIESFIAEPPVIRNKFFWKTMRYMFLLLWVIGGCMAITEMISSSVIVVFYIIMLGISEIQAKKINDLQCRIGKKVAIFNTYSELIEIIEKNDFESETLREFKSRFVKHQGKASAYIGRLAQLSGELEQRSNFMVHLFLNPLMLWDVSKAIAIDEWKNVYGQQTKIWIKTLGEWDALCSLGKFAFNHPDYVFPELTDNYFEMRGKNLGHPLLNRETCVRNNIEVGKNPYFLIVTGANMAGKSTYLRTVGVNFVLACMGAPVCADSLRVYPATLLTSLRTSDSLNDNESYFFAELKRLKMIIERLQAGEKLFIILDEILKGTNSVDKQKGSLALVQQFIRLQSCGIIATHDLLLGNLEKEFPENIRNFRFEADIKNDELAFSYRLQAGIAQNMNATFLMQKMGITI
jgi:FtsH-binding integral membrane protein